MRGRGYRGRIVDTSDEHRSWSAQHFAMGDSLSAGDSGNGVMVSRRLAGTVAVTSNAARGDLKRWMMPGSAALAAPCGRAGRARWPPAPGNEPQCAHRQPATRTTHVTSVAKRAQGQATQRPTWPATTRSRPAVEPGRACRARWSRHHRSWPGGTGRTGPGPGAGSSNCSPVGWPTGWAWSRSGRTSRSAPARRSITIQARIRDAAGQAGACWRSQTRASRWASGSTRKATWGPSGSHRRCEPLIAACACSACVVGTVRCSNAAL